VPVFELVIGLDLLTALLAIFLLKPLRLSRAALAT
jgi:hypothetical protein